jgi:Zn-finger nucleic acid-binding protein
MKCCPACGQKLLAAPPRPTLLFCEVCGGIWTDNATSTIIVQKLDEQLIELSNAAADLSAQRVGEPLAPDVPGRRCPDCEGVLERVHRASTNIDVCTMHGTWFDRGELSRVVKILAHERNLKDPTWRASNEYRVVEGNTSLSGASSPTPYTGPSGADIAGDIAGAVAIGILDGLLRAAID